MESTGPRTTGVATKDQQLDKVVRGGHRIVAEETKGLLASGVKMKLFHGVGDKPSSTD
jgi:COP9 signalosome complex subunit 5